jgi:hypothetical protein
LKAAAAHVAQTTRDSDQQNTIQVRVDPSHVQREKVSGVQF